MIVERSLIVPYSTAQMYHLVSDIPSYPQFLAWCTGASVLNQNAEQVTARIDVAYGGVSTNFTTENSHQLNESIDLRLLSGPFKSFFGRWQFVALGERGSKVSLRLDFEVDTQLISKVFGRAFEKIAKKQLQEFEARARAVYANQ